MRTAQKAGHMTAADQIVSRHHKPLDPRAPSTHKHLARSFSFEKKRFIFDVVVITAVFVDTPESRVLALTGVVLSDVDESCFAQSLA
jgi:hypothetical protein